MPECYGPRTTRYNRFVHWQAAGVWRRLLEAVSAAHNGDVVMIDSSCVRVHQRGATTKRGRQRSLQKTLPGFSDHQDPRRSGWDGRPIQLPLTAGQAGDAPMGASFWHASRRAGFFPLTRPTTPTPSGPRRRGAAHSPKCRRVSSARSPSLSDRGSIASGPTSSVSSTASKAAWSYHARGAPTGDFPRSSQARRRSYLD